MFVILNMSLCSVFPHPLYAAAHNLPEVSIIAAQPFLDLGTLMQGEVKVIKPEDPGALCYQIVGPKGALISISITPESMSSPNGPPLVFRRSSVMYSTSLVNASRIELMSAYQSNAILQLPQAGEGVAGNAASVYLWIGGCLSVPQGFSIGSKVSVHLVVTMTDEHYDRSLLEGYIDEAEQRARSEFRPES